MEGGGTAGAGEAGKVVERRREGGEGVSSRTRGQDAGGEGEMVCEKMIKEGKGVEQKRPESKCRMRERNVVNTTGRVRE